MPIKNLKSQAGFTLVEVMIAVFIIGAVLTAIFTLQNQTFLSVQRNTKRLLQQLQLNSALMYAEGERIRGVSADEVKLVDHKIDASGVQYALEKPRKGSILNLFEGIKIEQVSVGGTASGAQIMFHLVFAPDKPTEDKK